MKSKEVLKLLNVTRQSLTRYVKDGLIKITILPTGRYDYDEESVYNFINKGIKRKNYIYSRVSTDKQKNDLKNQTEMLKTYCFKKGYMIDGIYEDVASGISFENRKKFFELMGDVLNYKVDKVIISYKDRLSRVGFEMFKMLFSKFGTEIEVVSEQGSNKLDSEEVFEEIVSLLHCYSMKLYSKRRNKKIYELCEAEIN